MVLSQGERPETEVTEKTQRRRFTAEYKRKIVQAADNCTRPGELGALLRREGLYSSHLSLWREKIQRSELESLKPKKRGPKPTVVDPRDKKIAQLEREISKLAARAERAEMLVDVQKKVANLLGLTLPKSDEESS